MENCTVVITPRDRFSTIETALSNVLKTVPESCEVILSMGGCPSTLQQYLEKKFKPRVQFLTEPEFKNTAQLRNAALKISKTRLAAFLDSDVFVRPGWLEELVQCQKETGASLVTPLVQDRNNRIHTGGNRFYLFKEKGRSYVQMELCYAGMPASPENNLERCETDFAEIHCNLIVAEDARFVGGYEEGLREGHEMDYGLTLKKAGKKQVFEPKARVYLYYRDLIDDVNDVRFFMWKWNMKAMNDSFEFFFKKWNLDVNYRGQFTHYLGTVNHRVGPLTKRIPSRFSIQIDKVLRFILSKIERLI